MISRFDIERAVLSSDLPGYSRELVLILASKIDRRTGAIRHPPALRQLAREAGIHRTTVLRHMRVLEARGWVVRHPRDPRARRDLGRRLHQPTRYELLIPHPQPQGGMVHDAPGLGAAGDKSMVHDAPGLGAAGDKSMVHDAPGIPGTSSGSHRRQESEDDLILAVLQEAEMRGRGVSKAQAAAIVKQILAGRTIHTSAQAYVREAIRRTPDKYLPVRGLPNARDLCGICGSSKHITAYCPEQFTNEGE
jgi:hypothetical protein